MFGQITDRVRSQSRKVWSDRIDIEGLGRFLRAQHPEKTAANVEAETGIPHDTVRKWLNGQAQPNGAAVIAMVCAYGPELLHATVKGAPEWLNATVRERAMRELETRIAEQQARLEQMSERA